MTGADRAGAPAPPMIPRVVATDLDGTLLHDDGTLGERSRRALRAVAAAGIEVVLCTARPPRWLAALADQLGHGGLAVCGNGAVIWDLGAGSEHESFPIPAANAHAVVRRLRGAFPEGTWALERVDRFAHEPSYVPRWPVPDDTIVGDIDRLLDRPVIKLLLRHPQLTADGLLARAAELVGDLVELSHSSTHDALLEMAAPGVSKASSLERLCEREGIAAAEVMAFGDMPNDIRMLRWAGVGVAVANAHPDVLAVADETTLSNERDGVGVRLEAVLELLAASPRRPR